MMTARFASAKPKQELAIAIDFGTTYTGVAYAYAPKGADLRDIGLSPDQLRQKITVVQSWPGVVGSGYSDKVPTTLAYSSDEQVTAWGGLVTPSHQITVSNFKLALEESLAAHYATGMTSDGPSTRERNWLNESWINASLPNKDPYTYVEDFLKNVRAHIIDKELPNSFGKEFLANLSVQYVLTVPAIWSDKAKDLTQKAAVSAGIPRQDLTMVTEPEAAALYCSTLHHEVDLKDGDYFLVCDAGGGTVLDLISYKMITRHPFQVREATKGTGGPCGAVFLTDAFKELLFKTLGRENSHVLTPKRIAKAVECFENHIKTKFNLYDNVGGDKVPFEIDLPGAPDIPGVGLNDGYLTLSKNAILKHVFMPVFSRISSLVLEQVEEVKRLHAIDVKVIFLVGGLGSNALLPNILKSRLREGLVLKQPPSGHSAIMRGAVMSALGLRVQEHVMRRHYGVVLYREFEPDDPPALKFLDIDGSWCCKSTFEWYTKMGDLIPYGHSVKHEVFRLFRAYEWEASARQMTSVSLWISEADEAPKYQYNVEGQHLAAVKTDLKRLPASAVTRGTDPEGRPFYKISYLLMIRFLTTLEFTIMCGDKVYGSVVADYV